MNSGDGYLTVEGIPAEYVPGQTYPITVTLADPGGRDWGYEFVVTDVLGDQAGVLSNPDANSQIRTSSGREFASHKNGGTFEGTMNGPVSWTLDWTAPGAGAGRLALYASGNAADDQDDTGGDYIYNFALTSQEFGVGSNDAATMEIQAGFPDQGYGTATNQLIRGVDSLNTNLWVRNNGLATESYGVVTRVKLPNGQYYPPTGWLTQNVITLAPGEIGSVPFSQAIPGVAPTGFYKLEALVGFAPSTLVTLSSLDFEVIP
ncbi:MAG: hypothetical protein HQ519_11730 [Planctomycetes bacterium]|nr:hypothetical protein [Planctomycetota bacterium]